MSYATNPTPYLRVPVDYLRHLPVMGFAHYALMSALIEQIQWEVHDVDRKEAFFKRKDVPYHYGPGRPERPYFPQPEPAELKAIWAAVELNAGIKIEACFINWYENQEGNIGWHCDNSPTMDHSKPLFIYSLGVTRPLCIRPIGVKDFQEVVMMEDGSLLTIRPGAQMTHEHSIPRCVNALGNRLSLVFRPLL